MKAVISNRIYLNCEEGSDLETELVRNLRYEIDRQPVSPYPEIINNVTRVTPKVVSIPKGCTHYIPENYTVTDKRVKPKAEVPEVKATLREDQAKAVEYLTGSGLIEAKPGWGKTIVGLSLAHKHQTKTLIITTTTMIRDMWIKEIKKWMGIEPGIIGGGKFNVDAPIVVGNIQTVRNRLDKINQMFGLVITDEVHRAPAATFTNTLNSMHSELVVGLSGTLIRKDGLHIVLPDYFGRDRFIGQDENRLEPTIHIHRCPCEISANEFIPWSVKINNLLSDPEYLQYVADMCTAYRDAGHKVLVVADRVEFLEHLHLLFEDSSFLITGKIKGEETRTRIMKEVSDFEGGVLLFVTQSIFSEGVSLNELSCLIPGTPINNDPLLEQLIGRIQRPSDNPLSPVVADINLSGNTGKSQANGRKKFYIGKGWRIRSID